MATLATVRTDIERKRFELKANLADLEAAPSPADKVALIESAALDDLDRDLRQRRNELDRLLRTYGDNHAGVAAASSAVEETEAELGVEIDRHVQSMRAEARDAGPAGRGDRGAARRRVRDDIRA